jgi:hypothetical protein
MKVLTVSNIKIQFDAHDSENNLEAAAQMIDAINLVIGETFSVSNPQIIGAILLTPEDVKER